MPTTLQRSQVTHTPDVQAALDVGRRRWPEDRDRPATILARLAVAGAGAVGGELPAHPSGLLVLPARGRVLTAAKVEETLRGAY